MVDSGAVRGVRRDGGGLHGSGPPVRPRPGHPVRLHGGEDAAGHNQDDQGRAARKGTVYASTTAAVRFGVKSQSRVQIFILEASVLFCSVLFVLSSLPVEEARNSAEIIKGAS